MLHDIALIKLKSRVRFTPFIRPICLPQGRMLTSYRLSGNVTVAGWGSIDPDPDRNIFPSKLQHISIPVVSLKQCQAIFLKSNIDEGNHYCAGGEGRDSCVGDSGGPMMKSFVDGSSRTYFIFGLVSYGSDVCGYPAVYTNVPEHIKWILDKISN
ncbi:unnamed protein product [Acanthoscelides obtectus]|uniref:Peptidase S1 domain-containing protein n=1 Tax=Acanthoscelides obtectus TaxID=200917 RepID=A0A9P0M689_ACAOB|nr:unnamed protein product [Acanthoscelides obtectus]CAK1687983.1 Phenoloxidase-activating factor 1 [Acanthoscelides obtectus]